MLVSMTIENWMSFRDPATLSMVATKERQHGERVPRIAKYRTRLLPVAAVYGGNASGKTNLFKALSFMRSFVVDGTKPGDWIPVNPYLLDGNADRPTKFSIAILADETMYELSFVVTARQVSQESLVRISSTSERVLYHRTGPKGEETVFDTSLPDQDFLKFAARGTRDNQLLLTNTVSQNISAFAPVYDWFRNSLRLISPKSQFAAFEQFIERETPLTATVQDLLARLDTGITRLGGEKIAWEDVPIPESLRSRLQSEMGEGEVARLYDRTPGERFLILRDNGSLIAQRMVSYHQAVSGGECRFELSQESDGTLRIMDLLPAFVDLSRPGSKGVYVIDELDRSLHTLVTEHLIGLYLTSCSESSRSQLLFTTHDLLLMDQELFRRDEMWVTERDRVGASTLVSFAEYGDDVRYDKDIRKSYLQGKLGGVPRIQHYSCASGEISAVMEGRRDGC